MITSNINELLINTSIATNISTKSNAFLETIINAKEKDSSTKSNSLTYENIKGITLEEIDTLFTDDENKQMAKNLRIATLFTQDDTLGQALFNTVLGQPFDLGYSYLFDRYEDKNSFLSSFSNSSSTSLADLLYSSISNKINNTKEESTDLISQDRLDEILTKVKSFDFISALSSISKDKYGREEDDNYSLLYNDYALQYQELLYKYEEIDTYNKNIIKQF